MRLFNILWLLFIIGKDDDIGIILFNIIMYFFLSYKNVVYVWMKGGVVNILFG